jgi:hypothetical protein
MHSFLLADLSRIRLGDVRLQQTFYTQAKHLTRFQTLSPNQDHKGTLLESPMFSLPSYLTKQPSGAVAMLLGSSVLTLLTCSGLGAVMRRGVCHEWAVTASLVAPVRALTSVYQSPRPRQDLMEGLCVPVRRDRLRDQQYC